MYMSDSYYEPPEDKREVAAHCDKCGEEILEYEDMLISDDFKAVFCDEDCMKKYFGVREDYFRKGEFYV